MMNGEGILGPLPRGCRPVWNGSEDAPEWAAYWAPGFIETSTAQFTWIDPRLGSFPIDMCREEDTIEVAREILGRVMVDMLKERGVQLQEFDLV